MEGKMNNAKTQPFTLQADPPKHYCHARGCLNEVHPSLLMCSRHWRLVPTHLQREVWRHYRKGQEIDKVPSPSYLHAAADAINHVAKLEGNSAFPVTTNN